ncbi:acyl-CoA desaturase [Reinekea sp.]|jgi:stearoyl-CoA desaturase (delta-9 desaturase)|uniref:acyl-CoA desaturase n=1 Tax=Reinekea sp. TaxID=1970455 RepID=UPI002A816964|nr:fatty acid desaturase [Reinekea sp.]
MSQNQLDGVSESKDFSISEEKFKNLKSGYAYKKSKTETVISALVTIGPPLAFVAAIYLQAIGWYRITGFEITLALIFHFIGIAGVEIGFHRLFSHNSFVPVRGVKIAFAIMGSMGFQGPLIWWAAMHRRHHRFTDQKNDPHSPYFKSNGESFEGKGIGKRIVGFFHAHMNWVWQSESIQFDVWKTYVKDLYRDKDLFFIHVTYLYWLALGLILPGFVGMVYYGSLKGFLIGTLWGGLVRIFFSNHLSYWFINSVSHTFGSRQFETNDKSTNSLPLLLALPTLGQNYHNNHHAFPFSGKMSYRRYEFDVGYALLWILKFCRLVKAIKRPSQDQVAKKRSNINS